MITPRTRQVHEILMDALRHGPEARPAFLAEACAGDADLRRDVESLLAADTGTGPLGGIEALADAGDAGLRFGPYRTVRRLGEGGMGTVYLGLRDDEEYDRQVAVKVLKPGFLDDEGVRRFRAERQILADLKHPGIAELYEGGTTEDGTPYFVMEYVEGEPIDRHCDARRLPLRDRLELYRKVCSAVAFAHRNLIVHRDLKPSNVLVTAAGEPRLLDFGIAKLLEADPQEPLTRTGLRPMTPGYASPEQLEGRAVTTVSDVYSLGVLLYELLTGHRPGPPESGSWEPERPSLAAGRSVRYRDADGHVVVIPPEEVSRARQETPARLCRRLAGDLDSIVLMALRKEPERRYSSVEELSEELRRHLAGLPVRARRATLVYRTGKLLRRHRGKAAAFFVAVLVLAGAAVERARQQREVVHERDRAQRVTELLVGLFEVSDPNVARAGELTVREVLDRGASRVVEGLGEDPELQADLMTTLGRVYRNLGIYETAGPLLEKSLELKRQIHGESHAVLLDGLKELAELRWRQGDSRAAESMVREILAHLVRLRGTKDLEVAEWRNNLALLLAEQGAYDEAESLYREALELKRELLEPGDVGMVDVLGNLATLLDMKGEYDAARSLQLETLALARRHFEADHPEIIRTIYNLGSLESRCGDLPAAEAYYREGLELSRRRYGASHPVTAEALYNVAMVLGSQGQLEEAERRYREALEMQSRLLEPDHPDVVRTTYALASVLRELGELGKAMALTREVLTLWRQKLGEGHRDVARALNTLASLHHEAGELGEAEAVYREALAMRRKLLGDEHPKVGGSLSGLAEVLITRGMVRASGATSDRMRASGETAAAESLLGEALGIFHRSYPGGHWQIACAESLLGVCLSVRGEDAEAERLLTESYETLRTVRGERSLVTRKARDRVIAFYEARGRTEEAAAYGAAAGMAEGALPVSSR